jgi:hypothetical protein
VKLKEKFNTERAKAATKNIKAANEGKVEKTVKRDIEIVLCFSETSPCISARDFLVSVLENHLRLERSLRHLHEKENQNRDQNA